MVKFPKFDIKYKALFRKKIIKWENLKEKKENVPTRLKMLAS
jgi:hypothetical protein